MVGFVHMDEEVVAEEATTAIATDIQREKVGVARSFCGREKGKKNRNRDIRIFSRIFRSGY